MASDTLRPALLEVNLDELDKLVLPAGEQLVACRIASTNVQTRGRKSSPSTGSMPSKVAADFLYSSDLA